MTRFVAYFSGTFIHYYDCKTLFFRTQLHQEATQNCGFVRANVLQALEGYQAPPFEPYLVAYAYRPEIYRRTAIMLFNDIKLEGFTGSYTLAS